MKSVVIVDWVPTPQGNLDNRKKAYHLYQLIAIILLGFFSMGAWWGGGKAKKEKQPSQTTLDTEKSLIPSESKSELQNKTEAQDSNVKPTEPQIGSTVKQTSDNVEKKVPVEGSSEPVATGRQKEEVEKIQGELKEIIHRTQQLQDQVKNNRSEIQQILQRAQIHEQILRSITLPPSVPTRQQIDAEEIVRREKLRLIAVQTKQTQDQLRVIQQARSFKASSVAPSDTKTSKTS